MLAGLKIHFAGNNIAANTRPKTQNLFIKLSSRVDEYAAPSARSRILFIFFVFWGPETNGTLKINQKPNGGQDKTVFHQKKTKKKQHAKTHEKSQRCKIYIENVEFPFCLHCALISTAAEINT